MTSTNKAPYRFTSWTKNSNGKAVTNRVYYLSLEAALQDHKLEHLEMLSDTQKSYQRYDRLSWVRQDTLALLAERIRVRTEREKKMEDHIYRSQRAIELGYPAMEGKTVTQEHADWCEKYGHATATKDGVVDERCPRCDAWTAPEPAANFGAPLPMEESGPLAEWEAALMAPLDEAPTEEPVDPAIAVAAGVAAHGGDLARLAQKVATMNIVKLNAKVGDEWRHAYTGNFAVRCFDNSLSVFVEIKHNAAAAESTEWFDERGFSCEDLTEAFE